MALSLNSICIFIITITSHILVSTASSGVIYDSSGNKLSKGIPYYVLPLVTGTGGGLSISRSTKDACPLDVTQEPFELNYGVPIIITPIVIDETHVHASYPISIEADVSDPCHGSKIWKVSTTGTIPVGSPASAQTVSTGGKWNTQESCFQVVEDDVMPGLVSYQIQYCPFKCSSNSSTSLTCYNVGIVPNESTGQKFLALTDAIFPVVFASSLTKSVQSSKR
ncbi:kunitz trypsin inhibitor 5-like isoform X2 [Rutidosis leptorrhynchoides]|uniref:kunitz trypsin inhibitor 5-like isoform X2 n=1 Tax=Rutidosis leptorrhynchoides TaxID=125765 RepID=UPI003A992D80